MTVNGFVSGDVLGMILPHEHIMVDFIGADKIVPGRYDANAVFEKVLPKLLDVKKAGCSTFIECTPNYIGRDVRLLKRLAAASGLNIITNTGYYGAANEKYLPAEAHTNTAAQIAQLWINEWKNGIDGTGIQPGFIKTAVDNFPLTVAQSKMIRAAALTHIETGLTIGTHTGDGKAAMEEMRILEEMGVAPSAWIWIHAQNEKDRRFHVQAVRAGAWVEFDGLHEESIPEYINILKEMKQEKLLSQVLISHDSGWYHVGEKDGGNFNGYTTIFTQFIPALRDAGFTEKEIHLIFKENPVNAFYVRVRKK